MSDKILMHINLTSGWDGHRHPKIAGIYYYGSVKSCLYPQTEYIGDNYDLLGIDYILLFHIERLFKNIVRIDYDKEYGQQP